MGVRAGEQRDRRAEEASPWVVLQAHVQVGIVFANICLVVRDAVLKDSGMLYLAWTADAMVVSRLGIYLKAVHSY